MYSYNIVHRKRFNSSKKNAVRVVTYGAGG